MTTNDRDSRFDLATVLPEDVIEFWFGENPGDTPLKNSTRWYKQDDAFDHEIEDRFRAVMDLAARGALTAWKTSAKARLALVILLDQFSRNVFRGTARAFAQDARASETALEAIVGGDEQTLTTVERVFLYMPLMHAEDVDLQAKSVAAFERLRSDASEDLEKYVANSLDYAKKHAEIIERFGRFPHRNAILGRTSTPEEIVFLQQPGSSF